MKTTLENEMVTNSQDQQSVSETPDNLTATSINSATKDDGYNRLLLGFYKIWIVFAVIKSVVGIISALQGLGSILVPIHTFAVVASILLILSKRQFGYYLFVILTVVAIMLNTMGGHPVEVAIGEPLLGLLVISGLLFTKKNDQTGWQVLFGEESNEPTSAE